MHRVTHSIRRILPAEIPTVTPLDGSGTRQRNEQELLNLGIVHIRGDVYSCCVQENTDDGRTWTPGVALPGVELSRGRPRERFQRLSPAVRTEATKARIERTSGSGANRKTSTLVVPAPEILPDDVVKQRDIIPHMWAGERAQ